MLLTARDLLFWDVVNPGAEGPAVTVNVWLSRLLIRAQRPMNPGNTIALLFWRPWDEPGASLWGSFLTIQGDGQPRSRCMYVQNAPVYLESAQLSAGPPRCAARLRRTALLLDSGLTTGCADIQLGIGLCRIRGHHMPLLSRAVPRCAGSSLLNGNESATLFAYDGNVTLRNTRLAGNTALRGQIELGYATAAFVAHASFEGNRGPMVHLDKEAAFVHDGSFGEITTSSDSNGTVLEWAGSGVPAGFLQRSNAVYSELRQVRVWRSIWGVAACRARCGQAEEPLRAALCLHKPSGSTVTLHVL